MPDRDITCSHKSTLATLVDNFMQWRGYVCPYCRIDLLERALAESAILCDKMCEATGRYECAGLAAMIRGLSTKTSADAIINAVNGSKENSNARP